MRRNHRAEDHSNPLVSDDTAVEFRDLEKPSRIAEVHTFPTAFVRVCTSALPQAFPVSAGITAIA